jgi:DNA anti-recombination protein RmuC
MNNTFNRQKSKAVEDIKTRYTSEISTKKGEITQIEEEKLVVEQQIAEMEKLNQKHDLNLSEKRIKLKNLVDEREMTESSNEMVLMDHRHISSVEGMKAAMEKKIEDDSSKTKGEMDKQYDRDFLDQMEFQSGQHDNDVAKMLKEMETTFDKDVDTVEKKMRQKLDDIIGEAIGTTDETVYSIKQSFKVRADNYIELFMNACSVGDTLAVSELIDG